MFVAVSFFEYSYTYSTFNVSLGPSEELYQQRVMSPEIERLEVVRAGVVHYKHCREEGEATGICVCTLPLHSLRENSPN